MVNYYTSNGDIEKFTNSYPENYIHSYKELPQFKETSSEINNFDSFPITIPDHDNFTLVGHMDFDGNNKTIDVIENVSIKRPEEGSYPDFQDIIGECEQEIIIKFSNTIHNAETEVPLHFRFLLSKNNNGQPFYLCYYVSPEGEQFPMTWITYALRGKDDLSKHVYLYTFQLNNIISDFDTFKSEYNKLIENNIDYYLQLNSEGKIVFSYYVLKFGSSYSDDYLVSVSQNDYIMDLNNSINQGNLTQFYIMGHNDFDNNLVTKDNIKITSQNDQIIINVEPNLKNYGHSITITLSKINSIWRYNKTVSIENYGFYPVTINKKFNGKETNDFKTSGDFFFASIKKNRNEENYMIIIYKLTKETYKPIIDELINDGYSDYYIHYPIDEMANKKHTYFDIIHKYPYQWENLADIFNWIIIKPDPENNMIESTDPNSIPKPENYSNNKANTNTNTTNKNQEDNTMIYFLMFVIFMIIFYIIYKKKFN